MKKAAEIQALKTRIEKILKDDIGYLYEVTSKNITTGKIKTARFETILEWINDFPEYFKSYSSISNKVLISDLLYMF